MGGLESLGSDQAKVPNKEPMHTRSVSEANRGIAAIIQKLESLRAKITHTDESLQGSDIDNLGDISLHEFLCKHPSFLEGQFQTILNQIEEIEELLF